MRACWLPMVIACGGGGSAATCDDLSEAARTACGSPGRQLRLDDNALAGCTHVLGSVHVPDATAAALAAMADVTRIDEGFSIFRGTHADLDPLAGVRLVGGELSIRFADALVSVDGLGGVCEVGSLWLDTNVALEDLSGLSSLHRVHGDVRIEGNTRLPASEIAALLARIEVGGTVVVANNGD